MSGARHNLNEDDWERVNAFHDGELTGAEAQRFSLRLEREPDLAAALDEVAAASSSLNVLKPQTRAEAAPIRAVSPLWRYLGAAAVFVLMVYGVWSELTRGTSLIDTHQAFQAQSFDVAAEDIRNVALASRLGVLDLTAANLAPVAARETGQGSVAHYAGLNGCRLSYFKVDRALQLPSGAEAQAVAWTTADGAHHAIVATGMDLQKFDAIATYLQHVTHDLAQGQVYASLTRATENAVPCVG